MITWAALGATVFLVSAFLAYRGLTSVRIIPVSRAELISILGSDLHPAPADASPQSADLAKLEALARDPLTTQVVGFLYPKTPLAEHSSEIRESWRITAALAVEIRGKRVAVPASEDPAVSAEAANVDLSLKALAKLCQAQIELEAEEGSPGQCQRAIAGAMSFDRVLDESLTSSVIARLVAEAIDAIILTAVERAAQSGVLDASRLAQIYVLIKPAPEHDAKFAEAIRSEFCLLHLPFQLKLQRGSSEVAKDVMFGDDFMMWGPERADPTDFIAGELNLPETIRRSAEIARVDISNCSAPWSAQDHRLAIGLRRTSRACPSFRF